MKQEKEMPEIEIAESFKLDLNLFTNAVNNSMILGAKEKTFIFELKKDFLSITTGDINKFTTKDKFIGYIKKEQQIKLGDYFPKLVATLEKDIKVFMENEKPLKVVDDYEGKIKSTYFIAPIIISEE